MRTLISLVFLGALTFGDAAHAQSFQGVALDRLPTTIPALGRPTVDELADRWRAPLADGGWVVVQVFPDANAARGAFDVAATTQASRPPARLDADTAGDDQLRLRRVGNVVLTVRSTAGRAIAYADALERAIVPGSPRPAPRTPAFLAREVDGQTLRWDVYGRRLPD